MTVVTTPPDGMPDLVENLARRVAQLERRSAFEYDANSNVVLPGGVATDGGTGDVISGSKPNPVTALAATAGALFDESFLDVTWALPGGDEAGVEVRVAKVTDPGGAGETVQVADVWRGGLVEEVRIRALEPNTTYDVTVYTVSASGRISDPTTVRTTTIADNTNPSTPASVAIFGGATTLVVEWAEVADRDVADGNGTYAVEVERSTDNATWSAYDTQRTTATIVAFGSVPREDGAGTVYYYRARVSAIDASGNSSAPSAWTTGIRLGDSQTGVISTDQIVTAGLSAAVIKFGLMHGDRIETNTLDAAKITASNLLVKVTLTTGSIAVGSGPGSTGVYLDSAGIRLYNGATRTVFLDAATGNAEFTGTIHANAGSITGNLDVTGTLTLSGTAAAFRSSTSGTRITIEDDDALRFYGFSGGPAVWTYNSSTGTLQIRTASGDRGIEIFADGRVSLSNATLQQTTDARWRCSQIVESQTHWPNIDNNSDLGGFPNGLARRWQDAYIINGVTTGSDPSDKADVRDLPDDLGLPFLRSLRPVVHRWRGGTREHASLLADDVRDRLAERGADLGLFVDSSVKHGTDEDGRSYLGLRYYEAIPILIRAIQQIADRVGALEARTPPT